MLADNEVKTLQRVAYQFLVARLEAYGNRLNEEHHAALRGIVEHMVSMMAGRIAGRYVFDLSTGGGKTQAIVAVLLAAHELGFLGKGIVTAVVCQFKVEALCDLKRDLIAVGIPENLIGLQHTYSHDPEKAQAFLSGKLMALPSNHATEPRTDDNESRPILLCTHNLVRSKADIDRYYLYRGEPRKALIWDEAMSKANTFSVSIKDLSVTHSWMKAESEWDDDHHQGWPGGGRGEQGQDSGG